MRRQEKGTGRKWNIPLVIIKTLTPGASFDYEGLQLIYLLSPVRDIWIAGQWNILYHPETTLICLSLLNNTCRLYFVFFVCQMR